MASPIIDPYIGVGSTHFGMSEADIGIHLGQPQVKGKTRWGEMRYVYERLVVQIGASGVVEITLKNVTEALLHDRAIVASEDSRRDLIAMSSDRFRIAGIIILLDLGISFPDEGGSPFPLTAFVRGRMDAMIPRCIQF